MKTEPEMEGATSAKTNMDKDMSRMIHYVRPCSDVNDIVIKSVLNHVMNHYQDNKELDEVREIIKNNTCCNCCVWKKCYKKLQEIFPTESPKQIHEEAIKETVNLVLDENYWHKDIHDIAVEMKNNGATTQEMWEVIKTEIFKTQPQEFQDVMNSCRELDNIDVNAVCGEEILLCILNPSFIKYYESETMKERVRALQQRIQQNLDNNMSYGDTYLLEKEEINKILR